MKTAIILGFSGQDGALLTNLLLSQNINIVGVTRNNKQNFKNHILLNSFNKVKIVEIKKYTYKNIYNLIKEIRPNYIYNFSGESSVSRSHLYYKETYSSIIDVTESVLKSIFLIDKKIKYFNTSSSECYGNSGNIIDESSPFFPVSPYGIAKSTAFEITKFYRENKNIFTCSGIMFNHESPLRNNNFVVKKIYNSIQIIKKNPKFKIQLGNIYIKRDWGWAPDFMKAVYLILNDKIPDDYIICSGNYCSLKTLLNKFFQFNNLNFLDHIIITKSLFRNIDIVSSKGNNKKIIKKLKWKPENNLKDLIYKMSNNIYD